MTGYRAPETGAARLAPADRWRWQNRANCRGEDVNLFFQPEGERQAAREAREAKAKEICQACPVRRECADYAIDRPEKYGTWGGLHEDERASARRSRRRRSQAGRAAA